MLETQIANSGPSQNIAHKTLRNFLFSFFGYVFPIAFSILITPIIVKKLGIVSFGAYVLINTITGFLTLVDLGIGNSIIKFVSEYYARQDYTALSRLIASANTIFLFIGIFGLCVFIILGKFFLPWFHINPEIAADTSWSFVLAGITFLFSSLTVVYLNIPKALQKYELTVKIGLPFLTLFNLASLVLVLLNYKLKAILLANLLVTACALVIYFRVAKKLLPQIKFTLGWSREQIAKSFRFGLATFVMNISNNTLAQVDRLIIPLYLSPAQLSYYGLPGNVAEKINGVTGSTTAVLFPMASSLSAKEGIVGVKSIYLKIFRNIIPLTFAMTLCAVLFSNKILTFWLGADFAEKGSKVLVVLAITQGILAIYGVLQNLLMGAGKVKFLMKNSIIMALVNLGLLFVFVPKYGIIGAAWAYFFSVLPILFIFGWVEKKFLSLEARVKYYFLLLLKLAVTGLAFFLLFKYLLDPLVTNLLTLVIVGAMSFFVILLLYKLFGFVENEDWLLFKNYAKSALRLKHSN